MHAFLRYPRISTFLVSSLRLTLVTPLVRLERISDLKTTSQRIVQYKSVKLEFSQHTNRYERFTVNHSPFWSVDRIPNSTSRNYYFFDVLVYQKLWVLYQQISTFNCSWFEHDVMFQTKINVFFNVPWLWRHFCIFCTFSLISCVVSFGPNV